ncbi:hypothetical protein DOK67_0000647 [Enterococcus sp. DIV0212c]|uniref:WxL protein peptidoglycan domain-containing protein n=1 Tax=Enterococcus sp. DIV0212c TaxID=2230867 RepID=UPI001A9AA8A7|nr:DUF916 domain-containing protein [Enterococcus sp. DIV0212c]MBO1354703.1 DUF916 domain-containing protein [Enterococcus sp. DIV0212c]
MKKRLIGASLFIMICMLSGCSKNQESVSTDETKISSNKETMKYDSAIEKGKEAIVDKDISKAIASFQLALEYQKDSEEAALLIQQAELYKEATALKEKKEYTKALKKATELVDSKEGSTSLKQYGKDLIEEVEGQEETGQSKETTEKQIKFNVTKKKNNSADNPDIGYFELTTKKGVKQKIQLQIENLQDQELSIKQSINSAWTSGKGTMEYRVKPDAYDPSLKHKMTDYITFEEGTAFTLAPKETKIVTAIINVPATISDGEALGGWILEENKVNGKESQNISASITAIQLLVGETPKENKFSIVEAKLSEVDYRSGIIVKIENPIAKIEVLKRLTIELFSEAGESVIKKSETSFKMAPNSYSDYGIILDRSKELNSGSYTVKMEIELEDGQVIKQEKAFKITQ